MGKMAMSTRVLYASFSIYLQVALIESTDSRLVVVLGMHRSGTSAITRGLSALGVPLGNNLMPPMLNNNDKGFFEDLEINELNTELLTALNRDWDSLSRIPRRVAPKRDA